MRHAAGTIDAVARVRMDERCTVSCRIDRSADRHHGSVHVSPLSLDRRGILHEYHLTDFFRSVRQNGFWNGEIIIHFSPQFDVEFSCVSQKHQEIILKMFQLDTIQFRLFISFFHLFEFINTKGS